MIIFRQRSFSASSQYKFMFPNVSKDIEIDEDIDKIPESTIKEVLKGWKNTIVKPIFEYEKGQFPRLKKRDYEDLRLFSIDCCNNNKAFGLGLEAGPALSKYYGTGFYWYLEFNAKTGKLLDISGND